MTRLNSHYLQVSWEMVQIVLDTVMGTWIAQGRDVLQSIGDSEIKTDPLFRSLIANTAHY